MDRINGQGRDSWDQTRSPLFNSDGLPWTSRLAWGWLLAWIGGILFVLTPLIGMYLGLWLKTKRRSALVFSMYSTLTILWLGLFFVPFPEQGRFSSLGTLLAVSTFVLWFAAAFTLRHEVMRYYSTREGIPFPLNPVLTAIFAAWYVGGHLRADFPFDETGKVGSGVLKLVH
jgi:hypothetical protein